MIFLAITLSSEQDFSNNVAKMNYQNSATLIDSIYLLEELGKP